jgi:hypothetical protein
MDANPLVRGAIVLGADIEGCADGYTEVRLGIRQEELAYDRTVYRRRCQSADTSLQPRVLLDTEMFTVDAQLGSRDYVLYSRVEDPADPELFVESTLGVRFEHPDRSVGLVAPRSVLLQHGIIPVVVGVAPDIAATGVSVDVYPSTPLFTEPRTRLASFTLAKSSTGQWTGSTDSRAFAGLASSQMIEMIARAAGPSGELGRGSAVLRVRQPAAVQLGATVTTLGPEPGRDRSELTATFTNDPHVLGKVVSVVGEDRSVHEYRVLLEDDTVLKLGAIGDHTLPGSYTMQSASRANLSWTYDARRSTIAGLPVTTFALGPGMDGSYQLQFPKFDPDDSSQYEIVSCSLPYRVVLGLYSYPPHIGAISDYFYHSSPTLEGYLERLQQDLSLEADTVEQYDGLMAIFIEAAGPDEGLPAQDLGAAIAACDGDPPADPVTPYLFLYFGKQDPTNPDEAADVHLKFITPASESRFQPIVLKQDRLFDLSASGAPLVPGPSEPPFKLERTLVPDGKVTVGIGSIDLEVNEDLLVVSDFMGNASGQFDVLASLLGPYHILRAIFTASAEIELAVDHHPPRIHQVSQVPRSRSPSGSDALVIEAEIEGASQAELLHAFGSDPPAALAMSPTEGGTRYGAQIPAPGGDWATKAGATLSYRVRATDEAGNEASSATVSFPVLRRGDPPHGVTAGVELNRQAAFSPTSLILVSWYAPPGPSEFEVVQVLGGQESVVARTYNTSATVSAAAEGSYAFKVRTLAEGGASGYAQTQAPLLIERSVPSVAGLTTQPKAGSFHEIEGLWSVGPVPASGLGFRVLRNGEVLSQEPVLLAGTSATVDLGRVLHDEKVLLQVQPYSGAGNWGSSSSAVPFRADYEDGALVAAASLTLDKPRINTAGTGDGQVARGPARGSFDPSGGQSSSLAGLSAEIDEHGRLIFGQIRVLIGNLMNELARIEGVVWGAATVEDTLEVSGKGYFVSSPGNPAPPSLASAINVSGGLMPLARYAWPATVTLMPHPMDPLLDTEVRIHVGLEWNGPAIHEIRTFEKIIVVYDEAGNGDVVYVGDLVIHRKDLIADVLVNSSQPGRLVLAIERAAGSTEALPTDQDSPSSLFSFALRFQAEGSFRAYVAADKGQGDLKATDLSGADVHPLFLDGQSTQITARGQQTRAASARSRLPSRKRQRSFFSRWVVDRLLPSVQAQNRRRRGRVFQDFLLRDLGLSRFTAAPSAAATGRGAACVPQALDHAVRNELDFGSLILVLGIVRDESAGPFNLLSPGLFAALFAESSPGTFTIPTLCIDLYGETTEDPEDGVPDELFPALYIGDVLAENVTQAAAFPQGRVFYPLVFPDLLGRALFPVRLGSPVPFKLDPAGKPMLQLGLEPLTETSYVDVATATPWIRPSTARSIGIEDEDGSLLADVELRLDLRRLEIDNQPPTLRFKSVWPEALPASSGFWVVLEADEELRDPETGLKLELGGVPLQYVSRDAEHRYVLALRQQSSDLLANKDTTLTLTASARDLTGNLGQAQTSVRIDTIAPSFTLVRSKMLDSTSFELSFEASEPLLVMPLVSIPGYTLVASSLEAAEYVYTFTGPAPQGSLEAQIQGPDLTGNVGVGPLSFTPDPLPTPSATPTLAPSATPTPTSPPATATSTPPQPAKVVQADRGETRRLLVLLLLGAVVLSRLRRMRRAPR